MPKMTLELAQAVAIGPFNPHIITPSWLSRWKVCQGEVDADLMGYWENDGNSFIAGDLEWDVSFERLSVSANGTGEGLDCGAAVAKVLGLLNHTPVAAVGNNFHFVCPVREWASGVIPRLGEQTAEEMGATEVGWAGKLRVDGELVEVDLVFPVADPGGDVVARFNFERRGMGTPMWEGAAAAAREFPGDYRRATKLVRQLFRAEAPDA